MKFIKRIFSNQNNQFPHQKSDQALKLIDEFNQNFRSNPQKTWSKFHKQSKKYYPFFCLNGSLNRQFKQAMEIKWKEEGLPLPVKLPSVEIIPWKTWNNPKLGDLFSSASQTECEIIYCTAPDSRSYHDPVFELDALRKLGDDENLAMIIIGEEDMFFKKAFVQRASCCLNPQHEDIGQDLLDFASEIGLKCVQYY
ncbi:MAG: hypothetical protein ACP5FK_05330 [bacterium]